LPAALAPEEFELLVPEKKANFPHVPTYLHDIQLIQTVRQAHTCSAARNIRETYVKVLKT
jgi:hypothetical protein